MRLGAVGRAAFFGLGGALVFSLFCAVATNAGDRGANAASRRRAPGPGPVIKVDADWLVNVFAGGMEEASQRYIGRTLLLGGWVAETGRDRNGWHIAIHRMSARPTNVRCNFGAAISEAIYKGATVEVMGDCAGYDSENDEVVLNNCRLIIPDYDGIDDAEG